MVLSGKKLSKSVIILLVPTFLILLTYYVFIDRESIYMFARKKHRIIDPNMKYILQWTSPDTEPFTYMKVGQYVFIKSKCEINNCYITSDRTYLNDLTEFDAILFHGPELYRDSNYPLPNVRSSRQKYVFASMESSHYYPIKQNKYENFFNWAWTYKLDSNLYYGYITIRDKQGNVIGPKQEMHWLKDEQMKPIDDELKKALSNKEKAAAWFVSNCKTPSQREEYVNKLNRELRKYKLSVDIFGGCGNLTCPKTNTSHCSDLVKKSYYFYLSFENSFSEDYVTEKLLNALNNNAVPIVYGGANYSRFMPDSAYLDAKKLGVVKLVQEMISAMNDTQKYYNFFKWRNHYSYHDPEIRPDTNYYCRFCSEINKHNGSTGIRKHFKRWWNGYIS